MVKTQEFLKIVKKCENWYLVLFQAPTYLPILEQAAASRTKGEVEEERSPLTDPLSGCRRGG